MKSNLSPIAFVSVVGLLLTGCLLKPKTVSARHFVLAPIATNDSALAAMKNVSIEIGLVKMPSYLLRDSMAVRHGANEIDYLEDALWAERLDQCLQQVLAADLSRLLSSDSIYVSGRGRTEPQARIFVDVQQFDVDADGRGTLIAQWRITSAPGDRLLKGGYTRLERAGAPPRGNPEIIAATLSSLAGEFSRDLAQSLSESVKSQRAGTATNVRAANGLCIKEFGSTGVVRFLF